MPAINYTVMLLMFTINSEGDNDSKVVGLVGLGPSKGAYISILP